MVNRERIESAFFRAVNTLRKLAPKDTGNLAFKAIKGEWSDENTYHIYVDENIAPYMVYTNEPWISSYWRGKQNPNEHWWNATIEELIRLISNDLQGKVENEEREKEISEKKTAFESEFVSRVYPDTQQRISNNHHSRGRGSAQQRKKFDAEFVSLLF